MSAIYVSVMVALLALLALLVAMGGSHQRGQGIDPVIGGPDMDAWMALVERGRSRRKGRLELVCAVELCDVHKVTKDADHVMRLVIARIETELPGSVTTRLFDDMVGVASVGDTNVRRALFAIFEKPMPLPGGGVIGVSPKVGVSVLLSGVRLRVLVDEAIRRRSGQPDRIMGQSRTVVWGTVERPTTLVGATAGGKP